MDARRLDLLLQLSRLGSMRAVAEERRLTTSTVSQQLATLAREAGTALLEPDGPARPAHAGRTPARRPRGHDPRRDRGGPPRPRPRSEPAGTVRVGGFATLLRRTLLPVVDRLDTAPDTGVPSSCGSTSPWRRTPRWPSTTWTSPWSTTTTWPRGPPDDVEPYACGRRPGGWRPRGGRPAQRRRDDRDGGHDAAGSSTPATPPTSPVVRPRVARRLHAPGPAPGRQPRPGRALRRVRLRGRPVPARPATAAGGAGAAAARPRRHAAAYAATRRGRSAWSPLRLVLDHLVAGSEQ